MFGFKKKKKEEVVSNKPKLSDYPPEVQAELLEMMREIGRSTVKQYKEIMDEHLDVARSRIQGDASAQETMDRCLDATRAAVGTDAAPQEEASSKPDNSPKLSAPSEERKGSSWEDLINDLRELEEMSMAENSEADRDGLQDNTDTAPKADDRDDR